jgi:hypothetical protein
MNKKPKPKPSKLMSYPAKMPVMPVSKKELKTIKKEMTKRAKEKIKPSKLKGKAAIKEFQKQISPSGMAKTKKQQEDALKKLMEKRYRKKK